MEKRIYRSYKNTKYTDLFGNQEIEIVEDGIIGKTEIGESKNYKITKIIETDNLILLFVNSISAIIVPKRTFLSDEEKNKFLDEVNKLK